MRDTVKILVGADLLFLMLLIWSGAFSGVLSSIVYLLAFLVPILFAILASKKKFLSLEYILPVKNIPIASASVFPSVALVAALAALSSLVLGLIGKRGTPNLGDSLVIALLIHALLPAILEELVFRYIPLRICERGYNGTLVLISALFFALSHHSFFSFGYAFLAGCIFMALDLVCESVIPSMVIHLFNNALSVLLMFYSQNTTLTLVLWLSVGVASLASLVYLFIKRRELSALVRERVISGEKYRPSYEILFLLIPSLVIAILEIAG